MLALDLTDLGDEGGRRDDGELLVGVRGIGLARGEVWTLSISLYLIRVIKPNALNSPKQPKIATEALSPVGTKNELATTATLLAHNDLTTHAYSHY
jgi:hypothetical protein